MADRLTDLVLGLQRMAENAKMRGDDLRYTQQQETQEHVEWLDHLLRMVDEVRTVFLQERKRFMAVEQGRVHQLPTGQEKQDAVPKFLKQGPASGTHTVGGSG